MRGRHFGFLGTLSIVWITARVGFFSVLPAMTGAPTDVIPERFAAKVPSEDFAGDHVAASRAAGESCCAEKRVLVWQNRAVSAFPADAPRDTSSATASPALLHHSPDRPAVTAPAVSPWPMPGQRAHPTRLNFYAYSFVRSNAQASGLVGGGQYGGSQSGFVATYALARFPDDSGNARLALLARGAIAHDRVAEHELAAGLRWQPSRRVPVTLTAERRFRNARDDAFAVYLAGGKSQVTLPLRFRLDAFAQAGLVSGNDGGPFFDAVARAERKFAAVGKAPVTLGTGIWSGGQKGIFRLDAGPTLGTEIALGKASLRVNADWRFRLAGDARPASGPALTLSTSF
jgi:hypothetical protein